jgi:hypothetical protein
VLQEVREEGVHDDAGRRPVRFELETK